MNKYKIGFEKESLNQYSSMFSSPTDALIELIANAYDADAENVTLIFEKDKIIIIDDGIGMNENDINEKFLKVGRNKRKNKENRIKSKRKYLGRKGNGRWGIFGFSKIMKLYSKKNNETGVGIEINFIDILKNNKEPIENFDLKNKIEQNGTCIMISDFTVDINTILKDFNNEVSLKLSKILNSDFRIFSEFLNEDIVEIKSWNDSFDKLDYAFFINKDDYENEVNIIETSTLSQTKTDEERNYDPNLKKSDRLISLDFLNKNIKKEEYKINKQPLKCIAETEFYDKKEINLVLNGWIGTFYSIENSSRISDMELKMKGIKVFSRGRLVIKNLIGSYVNTDSFYDSYITGEIICDELDMDDLRDITKISRDAFIESDERIKVITNYVKNIVRRLTFIKNNSNKKGNKEKQKNDAISNSNIISEIKNKIYNQFNSASITNIEKLNKDIENIVSKNTKFKIIDVKNKYIFISHKGHDFKSNSNLICVVDDSCNSTAKCIDCSKTIDCHCSIKKIHDLSLCNPYPSSYLISKLIYDIFTRIKKHPNFDEKYRNDLHIINTSFDNTIIRANGNSNSIMEYIKEECGLSYKIQYLAFIGCISNDYIGNFPTDIEFGAAWILDRNPKIFVIDRENIEFADPLSKNSASLDLKSLILEKRNDIEKKNDLKKIVEEIFNNNLEIKFIELNEIINEIIDSYNFNEIL